MHHHVGAELDRALQRWRGKSVVAGEQGAGLSRDRGKGGDVGNLQLWIGGCLRPDQGSACCCRLHRSQVGHVDGYGGDAALRQELLRQHAQAGVAVIRNDDARTGRQAVEQQRHRGHARTGCQCGVSAFQYAEHRLKTVLGRIAFALVLVAGHTLASRAVLEGRGQVDRWRQRAGGGIGFAARVDCQRFGSHLHLRKFSQLAATSRKASRAASSVCAISASPCADDRKPASKADGARYTPRRNMPWKKRLNASRSQATASA